MSKGCVFKRSEDNCAALMYKRCAGCPFFKTAEQLEESRRKCEARIDNLPSQRRKYIRSVYGGSRGGGDE